MKNLKDIILEKLIINKNTKIDKDKYNKNTLSYLVDALKKTLLSNTHTFKENDFITWNTGMSTYFHNQKDHKYYDLFLKEIEDIKDLLQFKTEAKGYSEYIGLKDDNTVCISIHFNANQKLEKSKINNIDISENIKKLLIK